MRVDGEQGIDGELMCREQATEEANRGLEDGHVHVEVEALRQRSAHQTHCPSELAKGEERGGHSKRGILLHTKKSGPMLQKGKSKKKSR